VNFLADVVKAHTHSEEEAIFPAITSHMEFIIPAYLFDHQEEDALFKAMKATLEKLPALEGTEKVKARRALHRDAIAIYEHIRLHATKEEELLIPLVEKFSSPAEQSAQVAKMMSLFDGELLKRVMPWMVERLGKDDRLAYLMMLKDSVAADAYRGLWSLIHAGVSAGVAASIVAMAP
jgi:hemerythrin-like domain-containing protein